MTLKKVSIIVPVYNEEAYILELLHSILDQTFPLNSIELIVVDGGSTDESTRLAEEFCSKNDIKLNIIHNPHRITPISVNMGLTEATGNYLIISTAHGWFESDFIKSGVMLLESSGPDVMGVGGIVNTKIAGKGFWEDRIRELMSSRFGVGGGFRSGLDTEGPRYASTVPKPMYRREVLKYIGYYDPSMVRNHDLDFNYRLIKSGFHLLQDDSIKSGYYARPTPIKLLVSLYNNSKWHGAFFLKHHRFPGLKYLIPTAYLCAVIFGFVLLFVNTMWGGLYLLMLFFAYIMSGIYVYYTENKVIHPMHLLGFIVLAFLGHIVYGAGLISGIFYYLFKSLRLK